MVAEETTQPLVTDEDVQAARNAYAEHTGSWAGARGVRPALEAVVPGIVERARSDEARRLAEEGRRLVTRGRALQQQMDAHCATTVPLVDSLSEQVERLTAERDVPTLQSIVEGILPQLDPAWLIAELMRRCQELAAEADRLRRELNRAVAAHGADWKAGYETGCEASHQIGCEAVAYERGDLRKRLELAESKVDGQAWAELEAERDQLAGQIGRVRRVLETATEMGYVDAKLVAAVLDGAS